MWRALRRPCVTRACASAADLLPDRVEHLVRDVRGVDVGQARRRRDGRVTISAAPGPAVPATTTVGVFPDPFREQQRVRLVLDVLESGQVDVRTAVLVEQDASALRQELRVGLVPSEYADRQRSFVVAASISRRAGRSGRVRARRPRPGRRAPRARTPTWVRVGRPPGEPNVEVDERRRHPSRGTTR